MPRIAAVARDDAWAFLPAPGVEDSLDRLRRLGSDGDRALREIERNPVFRFDGFEIDFTEDEWDFTPITKLNVSSSALRIRFSGSPFDNELKLFLIESIVWQRAKVQSLITKVNVARKSLADMGCEPSTLHAVAKEAFEDYLERLGRAHPHGYVGSAARCLCDFLGFRARLFRPMLDDEVLPTLQRAAKDSGAKRRAGGGMPAIPDDYLEPLVATLRSIMRGESERMADRVTAAAALLLSQTGLRSSEALGAVAGSLQTSPGVCGQPDLAYIEYPTFKGTRGDGNSAIGRTILNAAALEAYLWLDENCAGQRERLGTRALVVYPRQSNKFVDHKRFSQDLRSVIARNSATIPCLNTQDAYPELKTTKARKAIQARTDESLRRVYGIEPDDVVVYPAVHQFRVTVATKLYESGVDMHYIRKHMNHMDENTTAGYVRSDKDIQRKGSELVYRAMLGDGAELIGPHAREFSEKVDKYAATVEGKVKGDLDELVSVVAERYPLRVKVGGVCIRCGNVVPCRSDSETDAIFCAFGVCPNQCAMYFMADAALAAVEDHIALVDENLRRGHRKAAANELRKAQNVIRDQLAPELDGLDRQLERIGKDGVLERFPNLRGIVENKTEVRRKVTEWTERTLAM